MPPHMHAVIKIVSFLVFGAAIALGNIQNLLAGVLLILPLYLVGSSHLGHALKILSRLRWLFLSILIIYLFFTPGQLLIPELGWSPTLEGLLQGLQRIAALILLVLAVNWLIASTAQQDLVAAIIWCLRPLAVFGLPHERLAVRISLTLDTVHSLRGSYRQSSRRDGDSNLASRLKTISHAALRLFEDVLSEAESRPLQTITLTQQPRPPVTQWLIPLGLATGFYLLAHYQSELNHFLSHV